MKLYPYATQFLQNTQHDADQQIAYALEQGVNFIDTAEMYAVPPSPDTYGKTEEIIGNWIARNSQKRKDIVIATKIAGNGLSWLCCCSAGCLIGD